MEDDGRQVKLLSIFHYIVGAATALFACFPIVILTRDSVKELFTSDTDWPGQAPHNI